jgi:hypothetical protein
MTDILIDMTSRPCKRYAINRCHYCNHEKFPSGRPIMPDDKHAQRQSDGSYKCGVCVGEDAKKLLSMFGKGDD